jgi:hypothetical protein
LATEIVMTELEQQHVRISGLLSDDAKRQALDAAPRSLSALLDPRGPNQAVLGALQPAFPSATPEQIGALAFYVHMRLALAFTDILMQGIEEIGLTGDDISGVIAALQNTLDSENEISDMEAMQLQMLMDTRSKLLQAASDLEKSIADTDNALVQNIKQ